jgi:hypothetical protein
MHEAPTRQQLTPDPAIEPEAVRSTYPADSAQGVTAAAESDKKV